MTSYAAVGPNSALWWPSPLPGANLAYTFSLSEIQAAGDTVSGASLAIAPSGLGELQVSSIAVASFVLTAHLSGGQPGRSYRCQILITGSSGRIWEYVINLVVSDEAAVQPPVNPPPPVPGFGTPATWP